MNWKQEGYVKGQKVFIVSKGMFTRDVIFHEGEIIYAGTKILKVSTTFIKKLEFKNSNFVNGTMGYGYSVYKSKEEYKEQQKIIDHRYYLRAKARECVHKLTNKQLEQIIEWSKDR